MLTINSHRERNGARAPDPAVAVESRQRRQEQAGGRWEEVLEEVIQEEVIIRQLIVMLS